MESLYTSINLRLLGALFVTLVTVSSCDDAQHEFDKRFDRPSVILEEFWLLPSPAANLPDRISYPTQVLVNDTVTLAGRFHIDRGGTISLGNAKADLFFTGKQALMIGQSNEKNKSDSVDVVQFVVTSAMGEGPQPLLLSANGIKQYAPDITVLTKPALPLKTDTTLLLQELFNQPVPGFTARYFSQNTEDFFPGKCVTADGTIYLQASLDVYQFSDGALQNTLKANDIIDLGSEQVTIRSFSGMTVNPENTKMFLSLEAKIQPTNGHTTAFFLIEKDITSGQFTLINKTLPGSAGKIQGDIEQMTLKASNMKVDARGRLLFENAGYIARMDNTGMVTLLLSSIDAGQIFRFYTFYGYSPHGLEAYIAHENNGIMRYDLEGETPIAQITDGQQLNLVSSETKPSYAFPSNWRVFRPYSSNRYMALADGVLLDIFGQTIGAIIMDKLSIYAYAGLERGYSLSTADHLPVQHQTSGQARYVNFGYAEATGRTSFIGTDEEGTIYLIGGGGRSNGRTLPPRLYKLVKP